jgi:Ser/Thr protein kinase RdoA (MazF antagonist)
MVLRPVYSTIAGQDIAKAAEEAYPIGRVTDCHLVNRGFNDVYELHCEHNVYIARLNAHRARGPANVAYETAFLAHLKHCGIAVGAPILGADGRLWRDLNAPEGDRAFELFERLTGRPPLHTLMLMGELSDQGAADVRLLGRGHAQIHAAGISYAGPASIYHLDADHLLTRPLEWLLAAPGVDHALRQEYSEIGTTLARRLADRESGLSEVTCHGDNHGGNTFVSDPPTGERVAAWFDFDDGGPGFLAYDLSVLLWYLLRRTRSATLDESGRTAWSAFVDGYREVRAIPDRDFEAIGLFVAIRNIWFLGEFATRIPQWGTQNVSPQWLRAELALLRGWAELVTPAA